MKHKYGKVIDIVCNIDFSIIMNLFYLPNLF